MRSNFAVRGLWWFYEVVHGHIVAIFFNIMISQDSGMHVLNNLLTDPG